MWANAQNNKLHNIVLNVSYNIIFGPRIAQRLINTILHMDICINEDLLSSLFWWQDGNAFVLQEILFCHICNLVVATCKIYSILGEPTEHCSFSFCLVHPMKALLRWYICDLTVYLSCKQDFNLWKYNMRKCTYCLTRKYISSRIQGRAFTPNYVTAKTAQH